MTRFLHLLIGVRGACFDIIVLFVKIGVACFVRVFIFKGGESLCDGFKGVVAYVRARRHALM